jgi:hypothetical protein
MANKFARIVETLKEAELAVEAVGQAGEGAGDAKERITAEFHAFGHAWDCLLLVIRRIDEAMQPDPSVPPEIRQDLLLLREDCEQTLRRSLQRFELELAPLVARVKQLRDEKVDRLLAEWEPGGPTG